MAGKAAKKAEKASASTAHLYSRIILTVSAAILIKAGQEKESNQVIDLAEVRRNYTLYLDYEYVVDSLFPRGRIVYNVLLDIALYNFRSFSLWQAVELLVSSVVYYICYQGLVEAARMGVPGGAYFDVLVVCLSTQVVGLLSSYGWYIYFLIPGYYSSVAAYWVFRQLSRWVRSESGSEETSAREEKRQAKKDRKAARGPKFRVR